MQPYKFNNKQKLNERMVGTMGVEFNEDELSLLKRALDLLNIKSEKHSKAASIANNIYKKMLMMGIN